MVMYRAPVGKSRVKIYDTKAPGLAYFITAGDARSYYWSGRVKGLLCPIDFHLGDANALSVDAARTIAKQVAADAAQGIDPRAARKEAKVKAAAEAEALSTVGQLWTDYLEKHVKPKCSAGTLRTDQSRYKLHLSAWGKRPVQSITREDVEAFHIDLSAKKTGNVADKTIKLLRRMLTWAKVNPNPAGAGAVDFHGDNRRERYLSHDELTRLVTALDRCENQTIADAIRFGLFTGARRGNVQAASWADMHLGEGAWTIPADQSKNRKPMTISLPPDAVALLERRKAVADPDAAYVFPGKFAGEPLRELKTTWERVRESAGIPDVHFHDLRHTLASWMAKSGASLLQIGRQLGHANHQSTARYAHLDRRDVAPVTAVAVASMFATAKPAKSGRKQR